MSLRKKAINFSYSAHEGQFRKYSDGDVPYWEHCKNVAHMVDRRLSADHPFREEVIAAAYLHDTVEDTEVTYMELVREFGHRVAWLVSELTDQYTPERYPDNNRRWRKGMEAVRLGTVSTEAKLIKLCDLIDNTRSIVEHDPDFSVTYLREKADVLEAMGYGR